MKKSIYKVTGWSLAISAAILFGMHKNNVQTSPITSNSGAGYVSNMDENGTSQDQGKGVDYGTSYANNGSFNNQTNIEANTINSTNTITSNNRVQDVASVEGMRILENKKTEESLNDYDNEINSQDALAKGGPNNTESVTGQQYSNTIPSSVSSVMPSNSSTSAATAPTTSARVSGPTVVTAPSNPSGSTSGGGGSGDPFVPIDDYYGLIFLIAISTMVGVFTIKKSRVV